MPQHDIFKHEKDILQQAQKIATNAQHKNNPLLLTYIQLTMEYRRLYLNSKALVKMSDRQQNKLLKTNEILESANQTKSTFLANMSHELRTPLNAILGYSEMLMEDDKTECYNDIDKIHTSGTHLLSLVNNLLDLSKIESGHAELFLEMLDVKSFIENLETSVLPLAQKGRNLFTIKNNSFITQIYTDQIKLRQILLNLLSNACKFTHHGEITLLIERITHPKGDLISFSIQDTGIGIKQQDMEHIFDEFVQADMSTTKIYGGTGLGLCISQKLCRMMDGNIRVHSVQGKGSTFSFMLDMQAKTSVSTTYRQNNRERRSQKSLILLIDSNTDSALLIRDFFQKQRFDVITAAHDYEALEHMKQHNPRVILLNLMIPHSWLIIQKLNTLREQTEQPAALILAGFSHHKEDSSFYLKTSEYPALLNNPESFSERLQHLIKNNQPHDITLQATCKDMITFLRKPNAS
jgi:signal transduction histidine kinase/CheY-like chemotaxis protein